MPDTMLRNELSDVKRRRLQRLYIIWAAIIVLLGAQSIANIIGQIGSTYGGFVWTNDPTMTPAFYVGFELWRSLPQTENRLQFMDTIYAVDGQPPEEFGKIYEQKRPGDIVTYRVKRGDQWLTIREPLQLYTWDVFLISHGLIYLLGWVYLLAGYALLSNTRWKEIALLSFAFLALGGGWFFHGSVAGIHGPYVGPLYQASLLWYPVIPVTGAIFLDFSLLFPTPIIKNKRALVYLRYGVYLTAGLLMVLYGVSFRPESHALNLTVLNLLALLLSLGVVVIVLHNILAAYQARRQGLLAEYQVARTMATVWTVASASFVVLGILPFLIFGYPLLPGEALLSLALFFPLALVYAISNIEMISLLHEEIALRKAYSDQVEELRNIRERTLHEVADALHDHIIPELRGLHLTALAAKRQADQAGQERLVEDLEFIADTLNTASVEARAIMEGAKPVDWEHTGLAQALRWLTNAFQRRNHRLEVAADVQFYDEGDQPAVKEALYWITRAALTNIQDHAQATRVWISLVSTQKATTLRITDNGKGFDPHAFEQSHTSHRRHLGLANMRLRAAEINAHLRINSQQGQGTTIEVVIPRGDRQ